MKVRVREVSAATLLLAASVSMAQDSGEAGKVTSDMPSGLVEYEMRIGVVDLSCGVNAKYYDVFDQEEIILDATVEFGEPGSLSETMTEDSSNFISVKVTTGAEWIGILSKEDNSVGFETKSFYDATSEGIQEQYGDVTTGAVLKIDKVSGEYIRGTIDGTIAAYRYVSDWLKEPFECEGEGTLLMLPK